MKIIILILTILLGLGLISTPYIWAYFYLQPESVWEWIKFVMWGAGVGICATFGLTVILILITTLIKKMIVDDTSQYKIFFKQMVYLIWINVVLFMTAAIGLLFEWLPFYIVESWFMPETFFGFWHVLWIKGLINLLVMVVFYSLVMSFSVFINILQSSKINE